MIMNHNGITVFDCDPSPNCLTVPSLLNRNPGRLATKMPKMIMYNNIAVCSLYCVINDIVSIY